MRLLRAIFSGYYYLTYRERFAWIFISNCVFGITLKLIVFLSLQRCWSDSVKSPETASIWRKNSILRMMYLLLCIIGNPLSMWYIWGARVPYQGFNVLWISQVVYHAIWRVLKLYEVVPQLLTITTWSLAIDVLMLIQTCTMFDEVGQEWLVFVGVVSSVPLLFAYSFTYILSPRLPWSFGSYASELGKIVRGFTLHHMLFMVFTVLAGSSAVTFLAGACVSIFNRDVPVWQITLPRNFYWSTRFMRSISSNRFCITSPCHVYLTAGEDLSSEIFVTFHLPIGSVSQDSIISIDYGPLENEVDNEGTQDHYSHVLSSTVVSSFVEMPLLDPWDQRLVYSAYLRNLAGGKTYAFQIRRDTDGGYIGNTYYYFELPSSVENPEPLTIVSGGDSGNTEVARKNIQRMVQSEPALIVIGGDVAYDNAMYACMCNWDAWLGMWETEFANYYLKSKKLPKLVPFVIAVGNHDLGVNDNNKGAYMAGSVNDCDMHNINTASAPIMALFPFDRSSVCDRKSYRVHWIPNALSFWILDSVYATQSPQEMVDFVNEKRTIGSNHLDNALNVAVYHVPLYSGHSADFPLEEYLRDSWGDNIFQKSAPFFSLALEHHSHMYKRTLPLLGGTVFVGDGAIGVTEIWTNQIANRPDLAVTKGIEHFLILKLERRRVDDGTLPDKWRMNVDAIDVNGTTIDSFFVDAPGTVNR